MLGSHREIAGNATRMARRTTSAHMNGMTPLKMVPVETSGRRVLSTNMFIPTGGLISPISTTHTMMMPNQTGSNPRCTMTGKKTGMVRSTIDSSSMAVFFPVIVHLGFDPVWFGIIIVCVVEIGLISPPVGMNMFVLKTLLPEVSTGTVFSGVMPFMWADVIRLAILVAFPAISLWLPSMMR